MLTAINVTIILVLMILVIGVGVFQEAQGRAAKEAEVGVGMAATDIHLDHASESVRREFYQFVNEQADAIVVRPDTYLEANLAPAYAGCRVLQRPDRRLRRPPRLGWQGVGPSRLQRSRERF